MFSISSKGSRASRSILLMKVKMGMWRRVQTLNSLMAADSAVMVIDAAKGVEAQTIKLFKVCTLRHIPIFTFINKMDREARDPFELMENIEEILGIKTYPMNWPIGCGKEFKGVFDRNTRKVLAFSSDGRANGVKKVDETEDGRKFPSKH